MNENLIIEKIKKLIALSECPSTTDSERLLALKRAQTLMLKYSISALGSLAGENIEDSIVNVEFSLAKPIFSLDTTALCRILSNIGPYFGCYCFYKRAAAQVFLMGFKVNCEIVTYTAQVLINQGVRDCSALWKENPSANTKLAFWKGFAEGLRERFSVPESNSDELVLYDKVRDKFLASTRMVQSFQGGSSLDAQQAGTKSALDAKVNSALSNNQDQGQLKIG